MYENVVCEPAALSYVAGSVSMAEHNITQGSTVMPHSPSDGDTVSHSGMCCP